MPVRGSARVSLALAIKHLTESMRDPTSKNVCAATIGIAALRIEEELERCTSTNTKARFVNAHPDLLRAGMHFLTANGGMAEAFSASLQARLYVCKCEPNPNDYMDLHYALIWARDLPEGVTMANLQLAPVLLFAAVNIVSHCLVLSLSTLTQHEYRSDDPGDSQTPKWPQGPDDLFPNGLEQTYKGLERWVMDEEGLKAQRFWEGYVPVQYNVYQLIGQLVVYHEPFAFSLLNFPKMSILFGGVIACLMEAGLLHKAGKFRAFERVLRVVLDFYDAVEDYDHVQFQAMMENPGKLLQNWWNRLNDVLAKRPEWNRLHRRVYRLAIHATNGYHHDLGHNRVSDLPDDFVVKPNLTDNDALEDAFNTIVRTRRGGCLNPRCIPSQTPVQTRLCSKCKVVRYCGEKCQKQAWKSFLVPHKDLCAKFEALKEMVGEANWEKMLKPGVTFAAFRSAVVSKPGAADLVKCVGDMISRVVVQKIENRKVHGAPVQNYAKFAAENAGLFDLARLAGLDQGQVRLTALTHPVL